MRTAAIDKELAKEHEQLGEAKAAAAEAAEKLSTEPGNKKHRLAVLEAQARADEINVTIEALNLAREQAVKFDQSEEGQATRAKRASMVATVRDANAQMVAAAAAVDEVLAALLTCASQFADARLAAQSASAAYLDLNESDLDTRMHDYQALNHEPGNVAHALALTLHDIVTATGLDCSHFLTFNPYTLTPNSGVGGEFTRTLEQGVRANTLRAITTLAHIEAMHTGAYVPPPPQEPIKPNLHAEHFIAANFNELMEHVAATGEELPLDPDETHTIAKDWDEYLAATSGLESPKVLHQE